MQILGFSTLGRLNQAVAKGETNMIINVAEALQSQKIVHIADQIVERRNEGKGLKLIMVSGPSSSGKTTFSKRLMVQLMAHGLTPKVLSLDDYFLDRDHTPLDENGEHDFESLYAIDLPFFNQQLKELLEGKSILPPRFNFGNRSAPPLPPDGGMSLRLGSPYRKIHTEGNPSQSLRHVTEAHGL